MKSGKNLSRKINFFYLQVFFALFFICGSFCHAADLFVDDNTCPQTGSGTSIDPYCSIQYALTEAVNGDTVYVYNGTYAGAVIMKTGVDLRNVPEERPVIVATRDDQNLVVFDGVNNCTLDGLILDASDMKSKKGDAVVLVYGYSDSPGNGLAIRYCEIKGKGSLSLSGIGLNGVLSIEITGNTIYNNKLSGIATKEQNSTDALVDSMVVIQGNTITQNEEGGIFLRGSGTGNVIIIGGDGGDANIISDNGVWSKAGAGIWLQSLQGVTIENNDIFNNGRAGILLETTSTDFPHITRNTIHDNFAAGINIGGDSNLIVGSGNEIFHNGVAGIAFYVTKNPPVESGPSSGSVIITGNNIYTNARAGISVIDNVTGHITINGNSIYQNEKAGIAFFNSCEADITENDIHDHTGAAGIFTGTWAGGSLPSPKNPPATLGFNRDNGPVVLTISGNKIHDNLSGMRLDHASATISNNLVYNNAMAGIRFSGNNIAPYEPFGAEWGTTELINNTVADNGSLVGGERFGAGIVYDDINILINPIDGTTREFFDSPLKNEDQSPTIIKYNIAAFNVATGIKDATCTTTDRDYNLYYYNRNIKFYIKPQIGGCLSPNDGEIFADPLFIDRLEYRLQPLSPAKGSGSDGSDMGAYGGDYPITW